MDGARFRWIVIVAASLGSIAGCSSSSSSTPNAGNSAAVAPVEAGGPDRTVFRFLDAVRTGDDKTASAMLTDLARRKTAELNLQVAPPGSETAQFQIGEVRLVGEAGKEEGAYVACKWTDIGDDGKPHTDEIVWMVQLEDEGWRIVGMGAKVFEDQDPVYLNFEDPEDMIKKQELVEAEIARRSGAALTAPGPQGPTLETAQQPAGGVPATATPSSPQGVQLK